MKKQSFIFRRILVMVMMVSVFAIAYADFTHTVERGETIQSIARKYGLTEAKLIEANPAAAQFVYVGMELSIPSASTPNQTPAIQSDANFSNQQVYSSDNPSSSQVSHHSTSTSVSSYWRQYGFNYFANFSDNGKGFYGVYAEMFNEYGWGMFMSLNGSYGIMNPGVLSYQVGPDYGLCVADNIRVSFPLRLNLMIAEQTSEIKIDSKGQQKESTDIALRWGAVITPKVAFIVKDIVLGVGLDINYYFGHSSTIKYMGENYKIKEKGKAYIGFHLSIGLQSN